MNNEFESLWKEAVVPYLYVPCRYLPEEAEEKRKNISVSH
jgi:hypothetical protein